MNCQDRKSQEGFTLAELLMVLAILSLVIVTVWPNLARTERSDMALVQGKILVALRAAQAKAIGQNRDTSVEIDVAERFVNTEPLPSSIFLRVTFGGETESQNLAVFTFFPDGTSTGGEVELRGPNETRLITVNWLTGNAALVNLQ
jgi:general secretion pathway protein H